MSYDVQWFALTWFIIVKAKCEGYTRRTEQKIFKKQTLQNFLLIIKILRDTLASNCLLLCDFRKLYCLIFLFVYKSRSVYSHGADLASEGIANRSTWLSCLSNQFQSSTFVFSDIFYSILTTNIIISDPTPHQVLNLLTSYLQSRIGQWARSWHRSRRDLRHTYCSPKANKTDFPWMRFD